MPCPLYQACDEAVSVHDSKSLHNNYEPRNNSVKSLMRVTQDRVRMLSPSILLPFYYDIPVGAKRLQRTRTKKAPVRGPGPTRDRPNSLLVQLEADGQPVTDREDRGLLTSVAPLQVHQVPWCLTPVGTNGVLEGLTPESLDGDVRKSAGVR